MLDINEITADYTAEIRQDVEAQLRAELTEFDDFEDAVSDLLSEWNDLELFADIVADHFDEPVELVWEEIHLIHQVAAEHKRAELAERRMNQSDNLSWSYWG